MLYQSMMINTLSKCIYKKQKFYLNVYLGKFACKIAKKEMTDYLDLHIINAVLRHNWYKLRNWSCSK